MSLSHLMPTWLYVSTKLTSLVVWKWRTYGITPHLICRCLTRGQRLPGVYRLQAWGLCPARGSWPARLEVGQVLLTEGRQIMMLAVGFGYARLDRILVIWSSNDTNDCCFSNIISFISKAELMVKSPLFVELRNNATGRIPQSDTSGMFVVWIWSISPHYLCYSPALFARLL